MGFITEAYKSLFRNRVDDVKESFEQTEGALDVLEELKIDKSDEELIELKKQWETNWKKFEPKIRKIQEENELYWLGLQDNKYTIDDRPIADNLIFESLETFLPIATRSNPEPVVYADNSPQGEQLAKTVRAFLAYHADRLRLKLRLKKICRYWALYLLGVGKIGWDEKNNDIVFEAVRPQKLILDPNSYINDDMEYTGEYVGEYIKEKASELIKKFPKKKEIIEKEAKNKLGTDIVYIEWWTDDFVFWTLKNQVLGKAKNQHWNYEENKKEYDEYGEVMAEEEIDGNNHFAKPKKPYVFLSVFNIGKTPFDATSLISQNIANQDIINSRQEQIERNVRLMNNLFVVSSDFEKEEASRVMDTMLKGGAIMSPKPNAGEALYKVPVSGLPADVYNQLQDIRDELRNIFGTKGSTPSGIAGEQTVRGKIIVSQQDASRIGGGVTEYLEQFADQVYNWFVQMMMVHYDEPRSASVLGQDKAREFEILNKDAFNVKLTVSVKEGSLLPKDELTQGNQAIDLAGAGLIDPITALDRLNFPDPKGTAERAFLAKAAPQLLFPEAGEKVKQDAVNTQMEQAAMQQTLMPQEGLAPEALTGGQPPMPEGQLPPIQ
jgi:hypothetical protein